MAVEETNTEYLVDAVLHEDVSDAGLHVIKAIELLESLGGHVDVRHSIDGAVVIGCGSVSLDCCSCHDVTEN